MRPPEGRSTGRLRSAAWELGVALAGETRAIAFEKALLIQRYLYFCWTSTRPWWIFRRLLAATLLLHPWREYVLIRLQRSVIQFACEPTVDLQSLYQAIGAEEDARYDFILHGNSSPAARRKFQRAVEEGLPVREIASLLKTRKVTIDHQGEVAHHAFGWRWKVAWFVLFLVATYLFWLWALAFRPAFGQSSDTFVFVVVAIGFVAAMGRIFFRSLRDEVRLVERLRDLRPMRSLGASKRTKGGSPAAG